MGLKHNEPGSGPVVATEAISSAHYQQTKLIDGTPGSTTPLEVTANGAKVDVSRVQGSVTRDVGNVGIGSTVSPVKQAFVDAASGADRTIVAAVSAKKIRILSVSLAFTSACTLTIKTGFTTDLSAMPFAANGQWMASGPGFVWETTTANQSLVFNVSAGSVKGVITYVEV